MKDKILMIINTVFVFFVFSTIFLSCNKEDEIQNKIQNETQNEIGYLKIDDVDTLQSQIDSSFYDYIIDLSNNTGVDIVSLSNESYMQNLVTGFDSYDDQCSDLTQEQMNRIYELSNLMQEAIDNDDIEAFEAYYQEYMELMFGEYNLVQVGDFYAQEQIADIYELIVNAESQIAEDYQGFNKLTPQLQSEVLQAVFQNIKGLSVNDCQNQYNIDMSAARRTFYIAMTGCAYFSTVWQAFAACGALAGLNYWSDYHAAKQAYNACIQQH